MNVKLFIRRLNELAAMASGDETEVILEESSWFDDGDWCVWFGRLYDEKRVSDEDRDGGDMMGNTKGIY